MPLFNCQTRRYTRDDVRFFIVNHPKSEPCMSLIQTPIIETDSLSYDSPSYDSPSYDSERQPARVGDFITLLKPRVMTLVVFTGIAGMIAAPGSIHPFIAVLSILWLTLGAGSAGAINMWYDRDIDALMKRTRDRPIPAGKILPQDALIFALILNVIATTFMGLTANWWAAGILAFATFFYAVIYTIWLKRATPQNIVIGGAAGAFPPLIGWTIVTGDPFHPLPWMMFALIFLWTPPHFWALSLITHTDYKKAGVPMLPVTHGEARTRLEIVIYTVALVTLSSAFVLLGYNSWLFIAGATLLNGLFLIGAGRLYIHPSRSAARQLFGYSIFYLFLFFTLLMIGG